MSKLFPEAQMKTDNNIWLTTALFLETSQREEYALFTLRGEDYKAYHSFPSLYLKLTEDDPTEYTFAMSVFGSWEHWTEVCRSPKLKPVVVKLREEMSVRQKSKAMKFMIDEVKTKGKSSFAAAKLLLDKPWETPKGSINSNARKAQKAQAANEDRTVLQDFQEDAKRLGLVTTSTTNKAVN